MCKALEAREKLVQRTLGRGWAVMLRKQGWAGWTLRASASPCSALFLPTLPVVPGSLLSALQISEPSEKQPSFLVSSHSRRKWFDAKENSRP